MSEPQKNVTPRYSRVEQRLKDLLRKGQLAKALTDQIAGTSEETANLFSSGTTPAVRILRDGR
jgi:hypothetical protein